MMLPTSVIQDQLPDNYCFGCGSQNSEGLQIKSYWHDDESVCHFVPESRHSAGPPHILNGGVIATIIDCHCVCTAMSDAAQRAGRKLDAEPRLWYATARLTIEYLKPTTIDTAVELRANITHIGEKSTTVACRLYSQGEVCVQAEVVAVRVPPKWLRSDMQRPRQEAGEG